MGGEGGIRPACRYDKAAQPLQFVTGSTYARTFPRTSVSTPPKRAFRLKKVSSWFRVFFPPDLRPRRRGKENTFPEEGPHMPTCLYSPDSEEAPKGNLPPGLKVRRARVPKVPGLPPLRSTACSELPDSRHFAGSPGRSPKTPSAQTSRGFTTPIPKEREETDSFAVLRSKGARPFSPRNL